MILFAERTEPRTSPLRPPADLVEDAEGYTLRLELPGVDPASVEVTLQEGTLTVRGQKPAPALGAAAWHRRETLSGPFERSVAFRGELGEVEATCAHGVLTVRIAKAPRAVAHRIPVRTPGA